MKKEIEINWLSDVEEHDYPAATSYLSLIFEESKAQELVAKLRNAGFTKFKAKDIFRASQLSIFGISSSHVENDIKKIKNREPLSPLLLCRDLENKKLIVADGYHRLCAVYTFNEDTWVSCKIV